MILYLYIEDIDDDSFNIHILEIQMVIVQYSCTKDADDDSLDDDVLTKPLSQLRVQILSRQARCCS